MRLRLILVPALALAAGLYFWKSAPPATSDPACTWRVGTGTEIKQGQNYDDLPAESPVHLSFTGTVPQHVYVFSHSAEYGTTLLFPSPAITSNCTNPLPAGQTLLPGTLEGKDLAWTTRDGVLAVTTFVAVAAAGPVAELEQLIPKLRRWSNTVFPDHSMAVTQPESGDSYIGKPGEPVPSRLLQMAADIANVEANPNGPMRPAQSLQGVFLASWKVRERRAPGVPELKAPELKIPGLKQGELKPDEKK